MADAKDLKSLGENREGSTPSPRNSKEVLHYCWQCKGEIGPFEAAIAHVKANKGHNFTTLEFYESWKRLMKKNKEHQDESV